MSPDREAQIREIYATLRTKITRLSCQWKERRLFFDIWSSGENDRRDFYSSPSTVTTRFNINREHKSIEIISPLLVEVSRNQP